LQLTESPLKAATITYQSWQLHLGRTLSLLDISASSCLLMRVNGSVPQPDAGQLVTGEQPNQSGYVGKRISLSFRGSDKVALE